MPVVNVEDLAYIRLQSPDLDRAEEFLTDLGMVRSARTADRLYMRGTDPAHHLHVTHLGPPKYLGIAFYVDGDDELRKLSQVEGASAIEQMEEPGGGRRVRFTDPHGYQIEAVCGMAELAPLAVAPQCTQLGRREAPSHWRVDAARRRSLADQAYRARPAHDSAPA